MYNKKECGVYKIINKVNNKCYIGSSINIKIRWNIHKNDLKNNKNNSKYLQRAWNKYGEDNFIFEIIESILIKDKDYILSREQYWLDYYQSYNRKIGYNINPIAGSQLGFKHSKKSIEKLRKVHIGRKISEETRKKLINSHLGYKMPQEQKNNISKALKGKIVSEKHKNNLSKALKGKEKPKTSAENNHNAKLTWVQVREIRKKYIPFIYSLNKLAKEYKVSKKSILNIIYNKIWKLKNDPNNQISE